jgi:hypothetical protein
MDTLIAKSLVVAGKAALAILPDTSRASHFIDHLTGAQIERRLWRTRLQQSSVLLTLLVGEECEREAHEGEPFPGHEAKCILCYASEVLHKDCPAIAEMIDAAEQVLCRIDDFGEVDFRGLGEALTFWGNIE